MRAARIHRFGPPDVIVIEEVPRPVPSAGELLVRVVAAGVGPWDALIREGKSKVSPRPPLILGSDLSGVIEEIGPGISNFERGDQIYGVTNAQFCGAQAEYAVASANMVSVKPRGLGHIEAASVPVVAVTAWQMLFDYGDAKPHQTVMILGAAGNVGAYAVQLAVQSNLHVIAVAGSKDFGYLKTLGCETVLDYHADGLEGFRGSVDLLIDTVGGETRERAFRLLKPGGVLITVVSASAPPARPDVRSVFFYVDVTSDRLQTISALLDRGELVPQAGTILPLEQVRVAHEMLAGAPHERGKIVLRVAPDMM
jgi:NADPH:quinone reductase-like Zn-dependent oxidoreductase